MQSYAVKGCQTCPLCLFNFESKTWFCNHPGQQETSVEGPTEDVLNNASYAPESCPLKQGALTLYNPLKKALTVTLPLRIAHDFLSKNPNKQFIAECQCREIIENHLFLHHGTQGPKKKK